MQQNPATRVSAPAVGLIATGAVGIALTLLWMLLIGIFGVAILADPDARQALPGVGIWMAYGVLNLALSALVTYAGWQMRQLRGWTLSMAGAIVAMLPCSGCCLLGLPIGIWAVVVLIDQEVKRAFEGGPGGPNGGYGPGGYGPGGYGPGGGPGGPGPSGYGPGGYGPGGGPGGPGPSGSSGSGGGYGQGYPPQS